MIVKALALAVPAVKQNARIAESDEFNIFLPIFKFMLMIMEQNY